MTQDPTKKGPESAPMAGVLSDNTALHRYVDGDLSATERDVLMAQAAVDPTVAARIEGLLEIKALVNETAMAAASDLDSAALFRGIEGQIESVASAETSASDAVQERKRPELRVISGGGKGGNKAAPVVPLDVRRRRVVGVVIGALAVAAAAAIAFTQSGPVEPEVAIEDTHVSPVGPDGPVEVAEGPDAPSRTEVLEVDFGTNVGTIFAVEGDEGRRYAVVWLDDDGNVGSVH